MTEISIKCPYCDDRLPKKYLQSHIGFHHNKKDENSKKRTKIVMIFSLVAFSIVLGMIYGLMLK